MIDRGTQRQIESQWRSSKDMGASDAQRLEHMIHAFLLTMRPIVDATQAVQVFWDNAGLLEKLVAAGQGEALDSGGVVTKESVLKYQTLFLAFAEWLAKPVTATVMGQETTLSETPLQLVMRQPERIDRG